VVVDVLGVELPAPEVPPIELPVPVEEPEPLEPELPPDMPELPPEEPEPLEPVPVAPMELVPELPLELSEPPLLAVPLEPEPELPDGVLAEEVPPPEPPDADWPACLPQAESERAPTTAIMATAVFVRDVFMQELLEVYRVQSKSEGSHDCPSATLGTP
jgi:hypothetical protein